MSKEMKKLILTNYLLNNKMKRNQKVKGVVIKKRMQNTLVKRMALIITLW